MIENGFNVQTDHNSIMKNNRAIRLWLDNNIGQLGLDWWVDWNLIEQHKVVLIFRTAELRTHFVLVWGQECLTNQ